MKKNHINIFSYLLFVLPGLLIYTGIVVYPFLQTIIMSFFDWDGLNINGFVGFQNFIDLYLHEDFLVATKNSLIYSGISTLYPIGIATVFVVIFSEKGLKFSRFFQKSYFIPVVLSITVVSLLWSQILDINFGLINTFLKQIGSDYQQDWLTQPFQGIITLALIDSWKGMGFHFIILFAGRKSIPEQYFEASFLEGASRIKQLIYVTLPLMAESYKVCLILCLTWGFRAIDSIFIITSGGGPGNTNFTYGIMLIQDAFYTHRFGFGCAVAVNIIILCALVMKIINSFVAREKISY